MLRQLAEKKTKLCGVFLLNWASNNRRMQTLWRAVLSAGEWFIHKNCYAMNEPMGGPKCTMKVDWSKRTINATHARSLMEYQKQDIYPLIMKPGIISIIIGLYNALQLCSGNHLKVRHVCEVILANSNTHIIVWVYISSWFYNFILYLFAMTTEFSSCRINTLI